MSENASAIARGAVDHQSVAEAARRLESARATMTPCAPVRDLIGAADIDAAYAVQRLQVDRWVEAGRSIVGRKIGLTSPAVQQQLGVDRPDLGMLIDGMGHESGAILDAARFLQPKAEAEVAFVLGRDLADGVLDADQIRSAIDYAVAALEICDSRIANWDITFGDTVADNASAGAYVLGAERLSLDRFEPREVDMVMTVDGVEVSTGHGSACLGDPLAAVRWLATQSRDLGAPLRAGQVILSGALGPMAAVPPGSTVKARISGFDPVTATFAVQQ
ncbi:fumarylacetoacetate hydrolase family protein [Gordonia McavH-238-E]|uniref:2-keto-4-pentenoate hydratase n=1 Tax=Gordonia sp. McavH-238-E TaxID=2917736 RepID=UPI001EF5DE3C|nr:fumarylacetoacetate hydrolase family protein [Gordonia sp. McavH-238-E]MCG7632925.1 fumarylacetoacetate hydrolase family protein [Gordonia sp. McavH-238-E]